MSFLCQYSHVVNTGMTYEKRCDVCVKDQRCGYCDDGSFVACQTATSNGTGPLSGQCSRWSYGHCTESPLPTWESALFGLAIVIGSTFVILALVLLILLLRRYFQQQRARTLLSRYEYTTSEDYVTIRHPRSLKPHRPTNIQTTIPNERTKLLSPETTSTLSSSNT